MYYMHYMYITLLCLLHYYIYYIIKFITLFNYIKRVINTKHNKTTKYLDKSNTKELSNNVIKDNKLENILCTH